MMGNNTDKEKGRAGLITGRYFISTPWVNNAVSFLDNVLEKVAPKRVKEMPRGGPHRILVANGAHLGDVVMATAVLPTLHETFPGAEISMLVGSWSAFIFKDHPLVSRVHTLDHWLLSRKEATKWQKFRTYLQSRRKALREIRELKYDLAIDLYFFVPNTALLLWQAAIPCRVGFRSAGFGPLYTHSIDWGPANRSILSHYIDLLKTVPGIKSKFDTEIFPVLPPTANSPAKQSVLAAILNEAGEHYLVIHMGSGDRIKEWPVDNWRNVAQALSNAGYKLVFTGSGAREKKAADDVMKGLPGVINACGLIDWNEYVHLLSRARLLICVDSVAGHVASAVRAPALIIGHGMTDPELWRPVGTKGIRLVNPTLCAPCYRKRGCATMDCIWQLPAQQIVQNAFKILNEDSNGNNVSLQS